ncbi:hypothetical protein [Belnapia sp. F-4-1]|uniref:hypothetical protein n=1 Tax=Belnapia sp. F-4-1 TaxID=1545443 RepID=UPI0019178EBF|nr:hypothetical protein [Belnapia sp. F-4-1]
MQHGAISSEQQSLFEKMRRLSTQDGFIDLQDCIGGKAYRHGRSWRYAPLSRQSYHMTVGGGVMPPP